MLEALFGEDAGAEDVKQGSGGGGSSITRPASPRNATKLSGLSNLGATCYLNSLLQTLHFTPEFRESLFKLEEEELGKYGEEEGADNSNVRIIPVQLQLLFARLLMLNQQSCRVDGLISSFGWTNNEELQQHDVQELNRILFAAIESSLVGTRGEHLIGRLYHGTSVQQIVCQTCGHASGREEEFQDIPVALTGRSGLEQALKEMYIETELLEGANQYHCSTCNKLVDAKRGCHLKKLPPILTFALLRFLYDFKKGERYKDTSQFKFPLQLNMAPYCGMDGGAGEKEIYELYSVVIHSGSTHSGHYTAYIRDVDCLGSWSHPDDEPVQLQSDPSSGKVDFIDFESPTDLLQTILHQMGGSAPVDKLCKAIHDKTGVSWNKRFKRQFGSINQFIKSCSDIFAINELNHVLLKPNPPSIPMDTHTGHTEPQPTGSVAGIHTNSESTVKPEETSVEPMETDRGEVVMERGHGEEDRSLEMEDTTQGEEKEKEEEKGEEGVKLSSNGGGGEDMLSLPVGLVEGEETPDLQNQFDGFLSGSQPVGGESGGSVSMETDGNELSQGGRRGSGRGKQVARSKGRKGSGVSKAKDPPPPPPPGHCWFQFNDTQVTSTLAKALEKMYQGKQSAYMLFYRRRSLQRPPEALGNLLYGVPEQFQIQVAIENAKLEEERRQYEIAVNTIRLNIHLSAHYTCSNGALHQNKDATVTVVCIDRRKTIRELKTTISEAIPEAVGNDVVISIAKTLPAGVHLYNSLSDNDEATIKDSDILDNSNLFIWDGKQVRGELIQTGKSCEPILLNVTYPTLDSEGEKTEGVMEVGRAKNSTLGELRALLASVLNSTPQQLALSQVKVSERNRTSCVVVFTNSKDKYTLEQLMLSDGDHLAAEASIKKGVKTLAHAVADKQNNLLAIIVEDRCSPQIPDGFSYPVVPMETTKDSLVSAFKAAVLSKINLPTLEGGCRLRLEDGPPLHEDQSLDHAGMTQGCRIILEPGQAPTSSQLALRCTALTGSKEWEVIVDGSTSVAECCSIMVQTAGLEGTHWHLRKTNWCGEAAEVLEDETASLTKEHIKSGDLLLIEEGKLPPKGFIRISISLYTPSFPVYVPCYLTDPTQSRGILSWVMDSVRDVNEQGLTHGGDTQTQTEVDTKEVPLHLRSPLQHYPPLPGYLTDLGTVEIHKDASVEELKALILTLPAMESVTVPTLQFLRVREVAEGHQLGKVFKQPHQTLRRHKLMTGSHVSVMVLDHEENVPSSAVFLNMKGRIPGQRKYGPPAEIIYDTTSTKPSNLIRLISILVDIPVERLVVSKHKVTNFEWIRLQDTYNSEGTKKGRKRKGSGSVNLKNGPINLKDGDYLGIKLSVKLADTVIVTMSKRIPHQDCQYDPQDGDDFTTEDDDQGKAILAAIQEEKRTKRKAKGGEDFFTSQRPRRAEVGLQIFVPDYKRTT